MIKHIILLYLFILINTSSILARKPLDKNNLHFAGELEKTSFFNLNNSASRFQAISTINPSITRLDILAMKSQLYGLLGKLENQNIRKKETIKAIKKIHTALHQELLDTFINYTYFDEIFKNGAYNCATATALYTWTFDYFDIPYRIVEHRNHVFIMVKSGKKSIMVETTDNKNGVYSIDKKALIQHWARLNIISKTEKKQFSQEQLFDKYFNQQKWTISHQELIASLYINAAIREQQEGNIEAATHLMQKSKYLYQNRDEKFTHCITIEELVLSVNLYQPETLAPLFQLIQHETYQSLAQTELVGYYETATRHLVLEKNNLKAHQRLFEYLIHQAKLHKNISLINDLERVNNYYLEMIVMN